MNQPIQNTPVSSPEPSDLEGRREALRKLGKYAAYAAPFTLLIGKKAKGQQSGTGSGGRTSAAAHRKT